jgi:hypothetical protein
MSMGIELFALVVGFMAGSGGAVGALSVWSGRRTGAAGLVGFGLVSALGGVGHGAAGRRARALARVAVGSWLPFTCAMKIAEQQQ